MRTSNNVNPSDAKLGVVAYTEYVLECKCGCRKLTNCLYKTPNGRIILAYDKEHAEKAYIARQQLGVHNE